MTSVIHGCGVSHGFLAAVFAGTGTVSEIGNPLETVPAFTVPWVPTGFGLSTFLCSSVCYTSVVLTEPIPTLFITIRNIHVRFQRVLSYVSMYLCLLNLGDGSHQANSYLIHYYPHISFLSLDICHRLGTMKLLYEGCLLRVATDQTMLR